MLSRSLLLAPRLAPLKTPPVRTTVIVKRVHKPPLVKVGDLQPHEVPRHIVDKSVVHTDDDKYMVYNIEEIYQDIHQVKVILTHNVDDYGVKGQIISFPAIDVQRDLILPGYAVYHNEENLAKYADIIIPEETKMNSSDSARKLAMFWSKRVLDVCMNMDNPWTIEKWHIKASLRKHKTWVPSEDCIEIPGGPISGPDLSLQNKEFISILRINNFERVKVRCRIHHLATEPERQIKLESWYIRQAEPVHEHERQELLDMNKQPPSYRISSNKALKDDMEAYHQWKVDRQQRLNH